MLKRRFILGLLWVVMGTLWVYAQPKEPAPSGGDPEQQFYGPEFWRLPPVSQPAAPAMPSALVMPPAEMIPAPAAESPPAANAPAALSGVLSLDKPLEIKASQPDKLWDGSFNLGLDGSQGNSETLNFRFGFHATRKMANSIVTLGLDYNEQTAQTQTTTNHLFFEGRSEWLINQTRWSWFVHETIEYDEFQPFDVRDASDIGVGYRRIKNENTTLIGRLGGGFSHEYGGPENGQYIPEVVFGIQFEHQISKRQKFLGAVEYAPDVTEFNRYRIRNQAALEVLLDDEKHLSMRMGVLERYNSHPNGALPNDLDYALTLIWKF